jgi:hypothetical protein
MDFRGARNAAQYEIFDARLRGGRHGYGIAVAPQPGSDPEDFNFRADIQSD